MKQPELGKKISELRKSNRLTQTELAEKSKLSLRTVQRIELSEVTPRSYTTKVLFDVLGYDYNSSMTDDEASESRIVRTIKYDEILKNLLKTNVMKKVSVVTLFCAMLTGGILLAINSTNAQQLEKIEGWFLAGSQPANYQIGLDKGVYRTEQNKAVPFLVPLLMKQVASGL